LIFSRQPLSRPCGRISRRATAVTPYPTFRHLPLPLISAFQPFSLSAFQRFSVSAFQHLPLALFVGTLAFHKGVDTLLDAFSDPCLRHVNLVVLGTGDPALTRRALPPNIRLLGHRPPAEVRGWMAKAWCLVHPTRADTSPNCVKEARVIGLPVVTTPEGGQTHYVKHLKSGFIHPAGDVEGLIQGVLAVTESQETSLKMGTTGQAACRAALTPAATAARLLEIYRTVQNR
jgi:glycosyltransferase involved in cell wall biosynthesis